MRRSTSPNSSYHKTRLSKNLLSPKSKSTRCMATNTARRSMVRKVQQTMVSSNYNLLRRRCLPLLPLNHNRKRMRFKLSRRLLLTKTRTTRQARPARTFGVEFLFKHVLIA